MDGQGIGVVLGLCIDPNTVQSFQWTPEVFPHLFLICSFDFWKLWILMFSIYGKLQIPSDS